MAHHFLQRIFGDEADVSGTRRGLRRFGLKFMAEQMQINFLFAKLECLRPSKATAFMPSTVT
jgi:hypothetical protein